MSKKKIERNKLLARLIALHGVRGLVRTELEKLHTGIFPSSKSGDYTDVKVVTPYGEIPWCDLSRISDHEMRVLMLDIEKRIYSTLNKIPIFEKELGSPEAFEDMIKATLFDVGGVSWDVPKEEMINRYSPDYKDKLKRGK